jgi:predicted alpha-1,2-mannosidase
MPYRGVTRLAVDPQEARQEARAGWFRAELASGIIVELTASPRVGFHRITYGEGGGCLLLDLGAVIQGDYMGPQADPNGWEPQSIGGFLQKAGDRALAGRADLRGGWGHNAPYSVYFFAEFSEPFAELVLADEHGKVRGQTTGGPHLRAAARFDRQVVEIRVGISYTSIAKARASLDREGRVGFDEARAQAEDAWGEILDRVQVEGGSDDERVLFTTSLYRLFSMPSDLGVDDEFPYWSHGVRHFSDFYCLWDSVRNANSLVTLLDPQLEVDFLNCLLDVGETTGWIPDAWIAGNSAFLQGGSSADILFAEAAQKGLEGVDYARALAQCRKNLEQRSEDPYFFGRYWDDYQTRGYVASWTPQCVSRHLEYAYQDWCLARLAEAAGDIEFARKADESSGKVWNLWHEGHRGFAPRTREGTWAEPFHPEMCRWDTWNDPWCYEATSRQWSWNVQHDFPGLVKRMGGEGAFEAMLDAFFAAEGQHGPGTGGLMRDAGYRSKETMLHVPWLYHQIGKPWKSAQTARWAMGAYFHNRHNGLHDNEDMGCQSAFYVCSALGLYPIMGQDLYLLAPPVFDRVEIQPLDLVITGAGDQVHVGSAKLNGQALDRAFVRHRDLQGGRIDLALREDDGGWGSGERPFEGLSG